MNRLIQVKPFKGRSGFDEVEPEVVKIERRKNRMNLY